MSTETKEAPMLSDEQLAKIAYEAWNTSGVPWESHIISGNAFRSAKWITIARAVRAALAREHDAEWDALNREIADLAAIVHGRPAVAPLRPGEMVTIPTANEKTGGLRIMAGKTLIAVSMLTYEGEWQDRFLDAAGVATLIETCRRWLAAQEDEDG